MFLNKYCPLVTLEVSESLPGPGCSCGSKLVLCTFLLLSNPQDMAMVVRVSEGIKRFYVLLEAPDYQWCKQDLNPAPASCMAHALLITHDQQNGNDNRFQVFRVLSICTKPVANQQQLAPGSHRGQETTSNAIPVTCRRKYIFSMAWNFLSASDLYSTCPNPDTHQPFPHPQRKRLGT